MISYSLKGQSALVTGANSGIGDAVANLVVSYVVNPEAAEAVAGKKPF